MPRVEKVMIPFKGASGERVALASDVWYPAKGKFNKKKAALFMPGYGSTRDGEKAQAFGEVFTKAGFVYITFDPRGHGESSGSLEGLTLDRHLEDLHQTVKSASALGAPLFGIGSSLGALTMAAYATKHPRAFCSMIGIGAAFGFLERWKSRPREERPPALTDEAIRSARTVTSQLLGPKFKTLALLWHGMEDDAVDWKHVADFAARARGFVELRLINHGDHRLTDYKNRIARESLAWVTDITKNSRE